MQPLKFDMKLKHRIRTPTMIRQMFLLLLAVVILMVEFATYSVASEQTPKLLRQWGQTYINNNDHNLDIYADDDHQHVSHKTSRSAFVNSMSNSEVDENSERTAGKWFSCYCRRVPHVFVTPESISDLCVHFNFITIYLSCKCC